MRRRLLLLPLAVGNPYYVHLVETILIYAIGTQFLGDAYNVANTLPNIVYNLALGGILTSVVVPLLVNAAKRDRDRGEGYDQRIFTLGVMALGSITLVATVAAAPITFVYANGIGNAAAYHHPSSNNTHAANNTHTANRGPASVGPVPPPPRTNEHQH